MALQPRFNQNRKSFAAANLKRCPLCGAVNAHLNEECFACSWHGEFDRDPATVEEGLSLLIDRCPELANATAFSSPKLSLWRRFRALFHKPVDLEA